MSVSKKEGEGFFFYTVGLGVALQAGAAPVVWEPRSKASRTPSKEPM